MLWGWPSSQRNKGHKPYKTYMTYKTHKTYNTYNTYNTYKSHKTYNPHNPHNQKRSASRDCEAGLFHYLLLSILFRTAFHLCLSYNSSLISLLDAATHYAESDGRSHED